MEKTRLFALYSSLSKVESKSFGKFLQSPYFNTQANLIVLHHFMSKHFWKKNTAPSKDKAWIALHPKDKYNDNRMRLYMSNLFKLLEAFLVTQANKQDTIKSKIKLASIYRKRNLPKHFVKTMADLKILHQENPIRSAIYFNDNIHIYEEEYRFLSNNKRLSELNLQSLSDNIDIAYMADKLRQTCFLIAHQAIYKKSYEFGLLPQIIEYIESGHYQDIAVINTYYYCYKFLVSQEESYFVSFKELIMTHGAKFSRTEIRDLYLLGSNYCIKMVNEGHKKFALEALDLYKKGLGKEIFFTDGFLSRFTYRNIAAIALMIKEYDWAEEFIASYKGKLKQEYQESSFYFNMAQLEYERKNYQQALDLLRQSEYKDLLINLVAKTLQLRIYYELKEFKLLDSHLDSMGIFIRRKNILGYHKEHYLKIIKFTRKVLSLNHYDKESKNKLKAEIQNNEIPIIKDWLTKQIEARK